jgi:hypothetical protein
MNGIEDKSLIAVNLIPNIVASITLIGIIKSEAAVTYEKIEL